MGTGIEGFPDEKYWAARAEVLRPELDELQRRFDAGQLPPADDTEKLTTNILKAPQSPEATE